MFEETIMAALDGARAVQYDPEHDVVMAWYGGQGVHAYDTKGDEVGLWTVPDKLTAGEVEEDMAKHAMVGYYPC